MALRRQGCLTTAGPNPPVPTAATSAAMVDKVLMAEKDWASAVEKRERCDVMCFRYGRDSAHSCTQNLTHTISLEQERYQDLSCLY